MDPVSVGILGCGTISDTYLLSDDRFESYEIVACADVDLERAEEKAAEYGVRASDPQALVDDPEIEVVVNLTPPSVHGETCREALEAGNHVYVEKPLAATVADAEAILQTAAERNLLVGSAPDTFLGAGLQTCRSIVDEGCIGNPIKATVIWTSSGHESWHPNPDLYYKKGGGPLFDIGSYYVTALVSLLGPATRATGSVGRTFDERIITSEPRRGETIDVEVPTHEAGIVDFASGAIANILMSFDSQGSTLPEPCFELYGTKGTLSLSDPNQFGGDVRIREQGSGEFEAVPFTHDYTDGRGIGVADLAHAIRTDWDHRSSSDLAYHVLEVLEAVRTASDRGEHIAIKTGYERPAPLPRGFPDK